MMITNTKPPITFVFLCCLLGLLLSDTTYAQQPSFQYVYDEIGQLKKAIDKDGNVLEYIYDEVGNILEIKRTTISGLTILDFNPKQGPVGTKVTIQGRGFSSNSLENTLEFNGVSASVDTATAIQIETTVPVSAITGPLTVSVAGAIASSSEAFVVVGVPEINFIHPSVGLPGQLIPNFSVNGKSFQNAIFKFIGADNSPKVATSPVINKEGTSATMTITLDPNTIGIYTVQAQNGSGSSSNLPGSNNTFTVVSTNGDEDNDGLSNKDELSYRTKIFIADTDGDGISDGEEVGAGSNPLDANSLPFNPNQTSNEVTSLLWSVLNTKDPSQSAPGEPNNPSLFVGETMSLSFSILNTKDPSQPAPGEPSDPSLFVGEAISPTFSVEAP